MKKEEVSTFSISFAGAGRVAGNMCREMYRRGHKIDLVVSNSKSTGNSLANDCRSKWSDKLHFPESSDVIVVSVPDQSLKSVLGRIVCFPETLVVHTAGSIGLDIFPEKIQKRGVFYPLQTFSPNRKISFENLPLFIESSDGRSSETLEEIASSLGAAVYFADTEKRRMLHLAAVFACNFTNHMFTLGKELAQVAGYPSEVLTPLVKETFLKALEAGPENSQTGPAVRNDKNTVKKHLDLLSFDPDLRRVYKDISGSIYKYHNKS